MTRLDRLRVEAFRGIPHATLDFGGGSLVLGGGNGTGKTAFVDALQFLYTGTVGTLAGVQGLSLRQHAPHVQASARDTQVSADYVDPTASVTRSLGGVSDVPPQLQTHLAAGAHLAFILRRSQLQEFIHARPADRYRRMADLVGAEQLDRTQTSLRRARDELQSAVTGLQTQLAQVEQQLVQVPDPPEDTQLLATINQRLTEQKLERYQMASLEELERIRNDALREATSRGPDPRTLARVQLATILRRGLPIRALRQALDTYRAQHRTAGRTDRDELLRLLQILRQGRDYLQHSRADRCPLCRQEIEVHDLLRSLVRRVADLEQVGLRQQLLDQARDALDVALRDLAGALPGIERAQREAGVAAGPTENLSMAVSMLRESLKRAAPVETGEMAGRLDQAVARWTEWAQHEVETLEAADGNAPPEPGAEIQALLDVLQEAVTRRAEARRGRQERERLHALRDRVLAAIGPKQRALDLADVAYSTFTRVKNDELQRVYNDLQADLVRLYDFLHPGEGHGTVAIAMDPRKRGSSELRMDFYQRTDLDPRAFGSEGHLDSLGLCIFLAFVKRFNGDWPLLVLDDVVASVDAAHKRRIATLLFQEFGDRQLFITTHDSRWFGDLVKAQAVAGRSAGTRNIVIDAWSLETGPQLRSLA